MTNDDEILDTLEFEYDPEGEDEWMSERTLVGGPRDGTTFTWDSLTGVTFGVICPVKKEHIALASYDETGRYEITSCLMCRREEQP